MKKIWIDDGHGGEDLRINVTNLGAAIRWQHFTTCIFPNFANQRKR